MTEPTGGGLIPEEFAAEIRKLQENEVVYGRPFRVQLSRDVDELRVGGVVVWKRDEEGETE